MTGRSDIEDREGDRPGRVQERAALTETRALYRLADAVYAAFTCPASAGCCQLTARGRQPWLWTSEWRVLCAPGPVPPAREDGGCPWLDEAGRRCRAYLARPFGCRTFFCARRGGPARDPAEPTARLLLRLEAANQRAWPEAAGPRPLLELADASR